MMMPIRNCLLEISADSTQLTILLVGVIVVFIGFFIVLLITERKRLKAEKEEADAKKKLQASYEKLEQAYQEVSTTKSALSDRYEELKRNREKINRMAYTDYLTELPNRVAFNEMLDDLMFALQDDMTLALMDIDIDNFKNINDTQGHSCGDNILIDITHRLQEVLDSNDFLARIGGDEFAVISQHITSINEYIKKIHAIQKKFEEPLLSNGKEFFITLSIGITIAPKDGRNAQVLLKNMDSAMYTVKEMGKNHYCFFNASINDKMTDKMNLQAELRNAIETKQFMVYYQALISLNTNRIIGFEALVRWNHPTRGLVMPVDFIPTAEESGLIVELGSFIFREACEQCRKWADMGFKDIMIAINFSARQFKDPEFLPMIIHTLNETGADPHSLEFEITESIALEDIDFTIRVMNRLRRMGISFSLDDFGTGYSSLSYLKKLPVTNLKIDKSFLDTIIEDRHDQRIVQSMIDLAQGLDISVIAEGVERGEQEHYLRYMKCDKAQGYLYSKPVPKEEAERLILEYDGK